MSVLPAVILFTSKSPAEETPDSLSVPIGLYNLRHVLNSSGIRCDVVDHQLNLECDYLLDLENGIYDIIGISVTHWRMLEDLNFLHSLKEIYRRIGKHCLFIAGGVQATINYKQWLKCGFDVVCLGYAEEALLEICLKFGSSKSSYREFLKGCDGVAFLDDHGCMVHNPAKSLTNVKFEQLMYRNVIDIDLPYDRYWGFMRKKATGILLANNRSYIIENGRLLTTSKCLARCGFCCCPDFLKEAQGSALKPMSLTAEQVHHLIVHFVTKYGAKSFSINDEDFLIGNKAGIERAIDICNLIIASKQKRELPENIRFSCQTRPNCFLIKDCEGVSTVNHRLMQALSKAGFHNISLGVETFSDRLLSSASISKGITSEKCHAVLKGLLENNLYPTINLILGIPESTTDELLETVRQVIQYMDSPCQISLVTHMLSFPGSAIFSSEKYPTHDVTFVNPVNNESVCIKKYFLQHDEEMGLLIGQLDGVTQRELENYRNEYNLPKTALLPRIIISLVTFLSIAKITNNETLLNRVASKIQHFSKNLTV
ncbi:MAG: cobalamin-dependent protein [Candidatus Riflebacteria bacterium]|nr:cobalamin-dependent protein [Candidatus Riflebacteria bacterium]